MILKPINCEMLSFSIASFAIFGFRFKNFREEYPTLYFQYNIVVIGF